MHACVCIYMCVWAKTKHIFISYLFEKWKKSAQNKVGDFCHPFMQRTRGVINSIP